MARRRTPPRRVWGGHHNFHAKDNPLFQEHIPLSFDGYEEDDVLRLTENQETDSFMSRWMMNVDPFVRYASHLEDAATDEALVLSLVRHSYRKFVLRGDWSEEKYVMVVDNALISRDILSDKTFEKHGRMYEEGTLEVQQILRRKERRKRV